MNLGAGIELERHERWNAVVFTRPRPVLSSAPVGGGDTRARRIVNLCVHGPDSSRECDDPAGTFTRLSARHGWTGPLVGLMTGVSAARLGIARTGTGGHEWSVLATAGTSNAHRAGQSPLAPSGPGTINIIAVTGQGLTAAARTEAIALIAEAKTALLADLGITAQGGPHIATGTGTDAVAVAAGMADDVRYTGYHTESGVALVAAVHAAVRRSLQSTVQAG